MKDKIMEQNVLENELKKPELLCYISIDIVGSTSYKMNNKNTIRTFENFYNEMPKCLMKNIKQYENLIKDHDKFFNEYKNTFEAKECYH